MSKTKSMQVVQDHDELPTSELTRTRPCPILLCGVGGEPVLAGVAEVRRVLPAELEAAFAHRRALAAIGDRRTVPDAS